MKRRELLKGAGAGSLATVVCTLLGPRVAMTADDQPDSEAARALAEYGARSKTAIGTSVNRRRQSRHCGNCLRLSAPINQTKCFSGKKRVNAMIVSTVNRVPKRSSTSVTRIRRSAAIFRAACRRSSKGVISSFDLRGFCGETSHHTQSRARRFRARLLIWRCPSCAGLKDPPSRPMRSPPAARPRRMFARHMLGRFLRAEPARLRGRRTCRSSTARHPPGPAHAVGPWRYRFPPPCRIRRRRRTGSTHYGERSPNRRS